MHSLIINEALLFWLPDQSLVPIDHKCKNTFSVPQTKFQNCKKLKGEVHQVFFLTKVIQHFVWKYLKMSEIQNQIIFYFGQKSIKIFFL